MALLQSLRLLGFRSVAEADIELRPVNVLVGANGAGKSNLVAFFRMLNFALGTESGLQQYVARQGGASRLVHFGPKQTSQISAELKFRAPNGFSSYDFTLVYAEDDSFFYTGEGVTFHKDGFAQPARWMLGAGHRGSHLVGYFDEAQKPHRVVQRFVRGCRAFHFHDTSMESPMRRRWDREDTAYLRADAGNLPAFLFFLRETSADSYLRIRGTLQLLLPWFDDFVLEPEGASILLRCRMVEHPEYPVTVSQLSDGSLRLMALITLLRQPVERRPQMIILDEPELGLHPSAEAAVADLIRSAAQEETQFLVATQSATFLSHFEPEEVLVVENEEGLSSFHRHTREELTGWLERYSLGQIWMKNLIGGRP